MSQVYDLKKARKAKRFTTPEAISRVASILGLPSPERYTHYTLRTRRFGVEVGLVAPVRWSTGEETGHWLNLSHLTGVFPSDFAAARQWVTAWADRHGMDLEERVKRRDPRPSPAENKLFLAGGCREEWLSSDVPKLWAEAVTRCQHAGGYCGQDGFCHYGDCAMVMRPQPDGELGAAE